MKYREILQLKCNTKLMFCQSKAELITETDEGDDIRQGSGAHSEILSVLCRVTVCVDQLQKRAVDKTPLKCTSDGFIGCMLL